MRCRTLHINIDTDIDIINVVLCISLLTFLLVGTRFFFVTVSSVQFQFMRLLRVL